MDKEKTRHPGKTKIIEARSPKAVANAQEEYKRLGERMSLIRKALEPRVSQQEVADQARFSYDYISRIERGKARPSLETLCEIALVLGVEIKDFFVDPSEVGSWTLSPKSLVVELENPKQLKVEKKFRLIEE